LNEISLDGISSRVDTVLDVSRIFAEPKWKKTHSKASVSLYLFCKRKFCVGFATKTSRCIPNGLGTSMSRKVPKRTRWHAWMRNVTDHVWDASSCFQREKD
jgi:hypothetical protein